MHDSTVHPPHVSTPSVSWSTAVQATLHCLTGCAVGEVLGMAIGTAVGLPDAGTVVLAVALAFVFGYAFTMRSGLTLRAALGVALAADTVSIAVMELIDNAVMLTVPGAMDAGLGSALFWLSLAGALAAAFVVTVPVNRWLMSRGKGHAVVHQLH